ncbi:MAG TPA: hypothetical protein VF092_03890 [Longimicrobium sp.]
MSQEKQPSTELEQLHSSVESLRAVVTNASVGALNAVPLFGGLLAAWISQFQQRELLKRLLAVLDDAVARIHQLEESGREIRIDDEYIEFVGEAGILAARTRSEQKRRYFSGLIACGAVEFRSGERDRGRMMATILNQMDDAALNLFIMIMIRPHTQNVHGFWGASRPMSIKLSDFPSGSGRDLSILVAHGLVELGATRGARGDTVQMTVTHLGISFFEWISTGNK